MIFSPHKMTPTEAEEVSMAISDVLCWVSGFKAGREGSMMDACGPEGIQALRDFNIRLKQNMLCQEASEEFL
jgi:hypothetical protein